MRTVLDWHGATGVESMSLFGRKIAIENPPFAIILCRRTRGVDVAGFRDGAFFRGAKDDDFSAARRRF